MSQGEPAPGARNACPPLDTLARWQRDQLPPEQVQDLFQHLETCPACLKTLEALVAADPVSRHLLQGPPPLSDQDRTTVTNIVRRFQVLGDTPHVNAETRE